MSQPKSHVHDLVRSDFEKDESAKFGITLDDVETALKMQAPPQLEMEY